MGRKKVTTACRDCKKCTNSRYANAGRNSGRVSLGLITFGASELALAGTKTCRQCGHKMSLHHGAEAKTTQPAAQIMLTTPTPASISEEIARLAALHDDGRLSDDEFATLKAKLISGR